MNQLEKTIDRLAADCRPTSPAPRPAGAVALWLALSCGISLMLTFIIALREDLATQMTRGLFWAEIATLTALVASSCVSAVWLAFPDLRQQRWVVLLPLPFLAMYTCLLAYRVLVPEATLPPIGENNGLDCGLCITLFALIPGLTLFYIMRCYGTTHPRAAGALGLLTSASIGHLALKFAEANDSVPHLLVWHLLPIIGLGLIGGWLGKKYLSW